MAETDDPQAAPGATPSETASGPPQVKILAHFVRDLSFENVGAIEGTAAEGAPEISIQVNLDGKHIGEDRYQVNMKLTARMSLHGYKQTSSRPKLTSASPPTTDIPRPTLDFRL